MQASNVQTAAAGLLAQLLNGGLGAGGALESGSAAGFVDTMGTQIRGLLTEAGADPAELAGVDNQTLVAQFIALMQGQTPAADAASGSVEGTGALLESVLAGLGDRGATDSGGDDDATEKASESGGIGLLPVFVLQQLMQSTELGGGFGARTSGGSLDALGSASSGLASSITSGRLQTDWSDLGALSDLADVADVLQAGLSAATGKDATSAAQGNDAQSLLQTMSSGAGGDETDQTPFSIRDTIIGLMGRSQQEAGGVDTSSADDVAISGIGSGASARTDTQAGVMRAQLLDLTKVLQPGGESRLAEQVKWCVQSGLETAEMKLHPPSLGTLDVRVTMEGDKASVQFVSPHPIVREVLEAAMPRLRDALAQEGVSLSGFSVSDQAAGGGSESGQRSAGNRQDFGASAEDLSEDSGVTIGALSRLSSRLDYFI